MRLKWQDGHDGQSIVLGRPVWTRLGRIWRMGVSVPGWVGSRRTRVSAKSLRWIKIPKQLKIHSVRGGAWNNSRILMDGIGLGCAECKHMPKKEHLRPFRICLSQVSSQDHRISTHVSLDSVHCGWMQRFHVLGAQRKHNSAMWVLSGLTSQNDHGH